MSVLLTAHIGAPIVAVTAPARLDVGGTFDLPAFRISDILQPSTLTVAIGLYTTVVASLTATSASGDPMPFEVELCDRTAKVFGLRALHATIESFVPVGSGLGGSSIVATCIVAAGAFLAGAQFGDLTELALIAAEVENASGVSVTGLQDQMAVLAGGVNHWSWAANSEKPLRGARRLSPEGIEELNRRIVVAFVGRSHTSSIATMEWTESLVSGRAEAAWRVAAELVRDISDAIWEQRWVDAIALLSAENALRAQLARSSVNSQDTMLFEQARLCGGAARFAGGGNGGCIWAIAPPERVSDLTQAWSDELVPRGGWVKANVAVHDGLRCDVVNDEVKHDASN